MINLVGNAVKFTQRGEVSVSITAVEDPQDRLRLRFQVRDTGSGMSPAQLEGLFIAFHQADTSITRKHGGTGLGLAICKQLVHLMQGELTVESSPGVGSTFTFTASFEGSNPDETLALPNLEGLRVVVVDANAAARAALASALRNYAVLVTEVATPELALAEVNTADTPYDLVFLEYQMHSLEVFNLSRESQARARSVVLIGMAQYGFRDGLPEPTPSSGGARLVSSVILKPFTQTHLLHSLAHVLKKPQLERHRGQPIDPTAAMEPVPEARILVVEDNPINQQIARELLESVSLSVDVVGDGREAVELILNSGPGACP